MQMHLAMSDDIKGAGMFSSVPYACSQGDISLLTICVSSPELIDLDVLEAIARAFEAEGKIDPLSNI